MKLRIKGNSLRLRVSQPEMAQLLRDGAVEETIRFAPQARLTYVLAHEDAPQDIHLSYRDQRVTIVLSTQAARHWAADEAVIGIYGEVDTGDGLLTLLVEKDFACLDGDDPQDPDAFPNPKTGTAC